MSETLNVGELIGEASVCWTELPKGVFNSERALEICKMLVLKEDYDQLLKDARELQKGLEHYESSHYDHNKNACFADKTATEALETFTKKYGSAE